MDILVTLRNEAQVSQATLKEVFPKLESLNKKNPVALWDLAEKCRDASYKILLNPRQDTVTVLKKLELMTESEQIPEAIQHIVLNSIKEGSFFEMALQNPLKKSKVSFQL